MDVVEFVGMGGVRFRWIPISVFGWEGEVFAFVSAVGVCSVFGVFGGFFEFSHSFPGLFRAGDGSLGGGFCEIGGDSSVFVAEGQVDVLGLHVGISSS